MKTLLQIFDLTNEPNIIEQIMKNKKDGNPKQSGGKRAGSGRPSLFKEETKQVKFMCPISKEDDLKEYINRKFIQWANSGL